MEIDTTILTFLPAFHATTISIAGSVLTAYGLYAFQEIKKLGLELAELIEAAQIAITPSFPPHPNNQEAFFSEGTLDWDGACKETFYSATTTTTNPIEYTKRLLDVFYYTFTSPPMQGRSPYKIQSEATSQQTNENQPFNIQSLKESQRRISFITWRWDIHKYSYIEIAKQADFEQIKQDTLEQTQLLERNTIKLSLSNEQKKQIFDKFHRPLIGQHNYTESIRACFEQAIHYEDLLNKISPKMYKYQQLKTSLRLSSTTKLILATITFLLILGVILPPLMIYSHKVYNLSWHPNLDYALLALTMLPYLLTIRWAWNKIDTANLQ